ncbi:MAG TPA: hypothetical protein VH394_14385 [Thermoanaerobaculia bacterium]|jgi:hypothetical protein|nr:hypothetical protein [Thermoanaerobaculia bacterium]
MSDDWRFHRDDPGRTEPYRGFPNVFQSTGGSWTAAPDYPSWQAAPAQDPVARNVSQSYMAFGQQLAQGMNPAAFFGQMPRQAFEQMLRAWSNAYIDTVMLWFDLFSPVKLPVQPPAPAPVGVLPFAVDVRSTRRTRHLVQLQPNLGGIPLQVMPFWAKDRTMPPLMDVNFITDAKGTALRIQVPDNQPAAVYFGVICTQSGVPVGSMALEIQS